MWRSQCGFCTPGFLVVASALLRDNPTPTDQEIKSAIEGNLCRCTGYQQIVDSVRAASEILTTGQQIEDSTSPKSDPTPDSLESDSMSKGENEDEMVGYRQQPGKLPFANPIRGKDRFSRPTDQGMIPESQGGTSPTVGLAPS